MPARPRINRQAGGRTFPRHGALAVWDLADPVDHLTENPVGGDATQRPGWSGDGHRACAHSHTRVVDIFRSERFNVARNRHEATLQHKSCPLLEDDLLPLTSVGVADRDTNPAQSVFAASD